MAGPADIDAEKAPALVAAIDFGTTFSGCSFSFRSDFDRDPDSVSVLNIKVQEQGRTFQAGRVPTCILFDPNGDFDSFGFKAQNKYSQMAAQNSDEAEKWYFFDRFKMALRSTEPGDLTRVLELPDQTQKKFMMALDVISAAIRYLKELLLSELQKQDTRVEPADILWVLTVPAIWDDAARQFMREAACKAGIAEDRLRLALEPEAASVFCHFHFQTKKKSFTQRGQRFMTVDCGGGTVDITAFEVVDETSLGQLSRPQGSDCGGTKVDRGFKKLLSSILEMEGMAAIKNTELVELMQNFEESKELMGKGKEVFIRLPTSILKMTGMRLAQSDYKDEIKIKGPNLCLPREIFLEFFEESKKGIIKAMQKVLEDSKVNPVDVILLVGGLSKSLIIQEAVRRAFQERCVLVPPSPDLTVLMGAVQFGHRPQSISIRVSPYTYGVNTTCTYAPGDDRSKVFKTDDGIERTRDIFEILVGIGEMVGIEQELQYRSFRPTHSQQKKMTFDLYRTEDPEPKYVTDPGCLKVGTIEVNMPDLRGDKKRKVQISISVSGTELKVVARDENTREEFVASCDFLGSERE